MAPRAHIRSHLAKLLAWSDAHVSFDEAVAGIPVRARGTVPEGLEHSAWQLVEHIRLAQADILEFCGTRYEPKQWPADYWPRSPRPPSARAWNRAVAQVRRDRRTFERLVLDRRRSLTARVPAGTGQTYLREILLAADHTAYHVGQLVVVRRLLGMWPSA